MKVNKSGWTLHSQTGTFESITIEVTRFFNGLPKELTPATGRNNEWAVKGQNGIIPYLRVIKQGSRYRLEKKPTK